MNVLPENAWILVAAVLLVVFMIVSLIHSLIASFTRTPQIHDEHTQDWLHKLKMVIWG
jgi:hypothetical protein